MGKFDFRKAAQARMHDLKQSQGLDDDQPPCGNLLLRKSDTIVRAYEEPVLPKLGKILFFSMLIFTLVMVFTEISTYLRYSSHLGLGHLLSNVSITGLGMWGIYSILLLPVCILGCHNNAQSFRNRQRQSNTEDQTEQDRARSAQAIRRLNLSYLRYLAVSFNGLAFWIALFLLVHIIF